jgi:hypothetical protein
MINPTSASCGVIKTSEGEEAIIVTGGLAGEGNISAEIFSLSQSQWRTGGNDYF